MDFTEKTVRRNYIYRGKILSLRCDDAARPDGKPCKREIVEHSGGAAILCVANGKVVLVRQYRYAYGEVLYEIPAGKLEPGEDPGHAIRRELKEEIGAEAERWDALGHIMPTVGYTDEMLYLFLARGLTFGERHLDRDEFLEPFKLPFGEALSQAADGRINDAKTLAALFRADRLMKAEAGE